MLSVSVGQRVQIDATGRGNLAPGTVTRVGNGFAEVELDAGGFRLVQFVDILGDTAPPPAPISKTFGLQLTAGGFDFFNTGEGPAELLNPTGLSFGRSSGRLGFVPVGIAVAVAAAVLWFALD